MRLILLLLESCDGISIKLMWNLSLQANAGEDEPDHKVDFSGGNVHVITSRESWDAKLSEASKDGRTVCYLLIYFSMIPFLNILKWILTIFLHYLLLLHCIFNRCDPVLANYCDLFFLHVHVNFIF